MKRFFICISLILTALVSHAQRDTLFVLEQEYTKEFLDTVNISKQLLINDYSLLGVQYGPAFNRMAFNPVKKQGTLMTPANFGVTYTKYGKFFGFMPYFGYQIGLMYGQDGYKFKQNKDGEFSSNVDGATEAVYSFVEVPFLSHFHADIWKIKLIAEVGMFGAYRLDVERTGERMDPEYANKFHDYENRLDYGAKFGAGIGLILDPIEIHFKAQYKWSWSSIYRPDYASEYYYRLAYPLDLYISAGIHFQITKRTGKTKAQLKKDAYNMVYPSETK